MKTMKKLFFLIFLTALLGRAGAAGAKSEYVAENTLPLVSPELIQEAGWTSNWQLHLPLKQHEQIDRMAVLGPDLFLMTNSNVMFCIDRETGRTRFTKQFSTSRLPVQKPFYYGNQYWFMVGSEMLVFDPAAGDFVIKEKIDRLGSGARCGLARNEKFIYVSGSDNRLHAINVDGFWQQFTATADNDSAIVSVVATDEIVVFATQAGNVVGMNPDKPEKRWQFDATGEIKGQLVFDADDIYVGSFDTKLYKLSLNGKLLWKSPFHSGAPIRDSFVVGRDVIYLYNELNGLYGISKQTGKAVWRVPSGRAMICETPDKGFVFVASGIVKVMDNRTGKERVSVNFSGVQQYAMNTTDSTMYVADHQGRLMSITVQ
jgi:outer membrane protein assembly factor BamB